MTETVNAILFAIMLAIAVLGGFAVAIQDVSAATIVSAATH